MVAHVPFPFITGLDKRAQFEIERNYEFLTQSIPRTSTLYDAIIDSTLTESDPENHVYKNLGDAVAGEQPEDNADAFWPAFTVGVIANNAGTITETGNIVLTVSLVMETLGNWWNTQESGIFWDFAGFTIDVAGTGCAAGGRTVLLRGLTITNSGTALANAFLDSPAVYLDNCAVRYTDLLNPATRKITNLTDSTICARNTILESPILSNKAWLFDCTVSINPAASYTLTDQDLYWFGGTLELLNTNISGKTITFGGTSKTQVVRDIAVNSGIDQSTASATWTLSLANTGSNWFQFIHSDVLNTDLSVGSAAGDTRVEGEFRTVTMTAPSTAGKVRQFRGSHSVTSTFNGPGNYEIENRGGSTTFTGYGVRANVHVYSAANPAVVLTGCDDSLILENCRTTAGAGAQPYTIDSGSDRSILMVAGSANAGTSPYTVAGTNASTTTLVIDENLLTSPALAEFIRDTIGTAIVQGTGIIVTVSDAGDTITLAADPEFIRDTMGTALTDSSTIDFVVDDAGDTITASVKDGSVTATKLDATTVAEFIRDTIGTALTAGSNISVTVSDPGDTITIAVTGLTSYPGDEAIQDLVGAMMTDTTSIDFTYDDPTGTITADVKTEAIQDLLNPAAGFIVAGSGMTITYDDTANTLTFVSTGGYTAENARDDIAAALVAGAGVTITVNDPADTITIASSITQYTDEQVRDVIGTALTAGTGITLTVNDPGDTITVAIDTSAETERAQDAIGAMVVDTATIDVTYTDATPELKWDVKADSIDNTILANMAQSTIKGRAAAAGTGDPTDLTGAQCWAILTGTAGTDISMNSHKLTSVTDPTAAQDAATMNYVDTKAGLLIKSVMQAGSTTTAGATLNTWTAHTGTTVTITNPGVLVTLVAFYSVIPDDNSGVNSEKFTSARVAYLTDGGSTYTAGDATTGIAVNGGLTHRRMGTLMPMLAVSFTPTGDIKVRGEFNHISGGNGNQVSGQAGMILVQLFRGNLT